MYWNLVENLQMANEASHIISSFSVAIISRQLTYPETRGLNCTGSQLKTPSLEKLARLAWRISYAMWQNKMFKTEDA